METSFEEWIAVVTEKYELDYPDMSKKLNISQIFSLYGLWSKDQKHLFFSQIKLFLRHIFERDLDGTNQVYSRWEFNV